ncbi:MAG: phage tail protein, partial [Lentisphaeria bacterium]|nr:phage tail protein [Lentisphaeria bacterium]
MKNQTLKLTVLTTSLAVFSAMAASYYVGPGGRDEQIGSVEAPFATLERARDAVRAAKDAGVAGPHEVVLLPGMYPLSVSFKLGAADAGTAKAPVVYRAAEAGTARLLGSTAIPATAFGPVTDAAVLALLEPAAAAKVLVADLAALGFPAQKEIVARAGGGTTELPELFCNEERMQLARWPDT